MLVHRSSKLLWLLVALVATSTFLPAKADDEEAKSEIKPEESKKLDETTTAAPTKESKADDKKQSPSRDSALGEIAREVVGELAGGHHDHHVGEEFAERGLHHHRHEPYGHHSGMYGSHHHGVHHGSHGLGHFIDPELDARIEREYDPLRKLELMLERERAMNHRLRLQLDDNAYEIESLKGRVMHGGHVGAGMHHGEHVKIGKYLEHKLKHVSHSPVAVMRALERRLSPRHDTLPQRCQKYYMLLSYPGKVDDGLIKHIAKLNIPVSLPMSPLYAGGSYPSHGGYGHSLGGVYDEEYYRKHGKHGKYGKHHGGYYEDPLVSGYGHLKHHGKHHDKHHLYKRSLGGLGHSLGGGHHHSSGGHYSHHNYFAEDYSSKLLHYAELLSAEFGHHEYGHELRNVVGNLRECAEMSSRFSMPYAAMSAYEGGMMHEGAMHHGGMHHMGGGHYGGHHGGHHGGHLGAGLVGAAVGAALIDGEAHHSHHHLGHEPIHMVHPLGTTTTTTTSFEGPHHHLPHHHHHLGPRRHMGVGAPAVSTAAATSGASASASAGGAASASASAAGRLSSHFPTMPAMPPMGIH